MIDGTGNVGGSISAQCKWQKMKSFLIDCVGELENVKSKAYLNTEEVT